MMLGLLATVAAFAAACRSSSEPGSTITKVISYPDTVVLLVGDAPRPLSAFTIDSSRMSHAGQSWYNYGWAPITASFSSSDTGVVKVDGMAHATAVAPGEATITAAAGRASASTKVYVLRYQPALQFTELSVGLSAMCGRTLDDRVYCTTRAGYGPPPPEPTGAFGTAAHADRCRTWWQQPYTILYFYDRCSHIPLEVDGAHRFTAVAVGMAYDFPQTACGLDDAAAVWCWGTQPVRESQLPPMAAISATSDRSYCGLTTAGTALCWNLGRPPTMVDSTRRYTSLYASLGTACALDSTGAAWCWGGNQGGVLGDGTTTSHASPAPVNTQVRFTSIVIGADNDDTADLACGLDASGLAYCWGTGQTTPAAAVTTEHFVSIAIAWGRACGVTQAGTITCWTPNSASTTPGPTGTDWLRVFGGEYDMCGLAASGRAACWALNMSTGVWVVTDIPRGG